MVTMRAERKCRGPCHKIAHRGAAGPVCASMKWSDDLHGPATAPTGPGARAGVATGPLYEEAHPGRGTYPLLLCRTPMKTLLLP
ncbi:hypothetical protein GCM10020256_37900 [Streptomyces thermocoprophilus]